MSWGGVTAGSSLAAPREGPGLLGAGLLELGLVVLEQVQQIAGRSLEDTQDLTRAFLKRTEQQSEELFAAREVGDLLISALSRV